ncbi:MAG TPA: ABC transporter ATP-binding protein [Acetobacteraceae bacterium]|nr:ABC transporter ATP-binding protein [Acetobacteraceae bacterium]
MIELLIDRVSKRFGPVAALTEATLSLSEGEFVALLGPSGCGKTTLLRIVAGLESASAGHVRIGERDVTELPPRARGLAMVFQSHAVFPHMTVRENIAFGLAMAHAPAARVERQVARTAALLHIEALLSRYPAQLSGGQRQRVAVARALAVEPSVLLMDEPLSSLDALLRLEMRAELKSVLREAGTTTLYVTHDQTEAMGLADRIAVMQEGRIVQVAAPMEVYRHPANIFVGGFVGSPPMNFLRLRAAQSAVALGALRLAAPVPAGEVLLGIRPEALAPVSTGGFAFRVAVVEPLGTHLLLTGEAEGQLMRAVLPPEAAVAAGAELSLTLDPAAISWMDAASGQALPADHGNLR